MSTQHLKKLMHQLAREPNSVLFAVVAEELRKKRRYYQALEVCIRGTSRNPNYAGGWFTTGLIYLDLEQYSQAKKTFKKVINLDPDHTKAYEKLLDITIHEKNWDEAAEYIRNILDRYPLNTRVTQLASHVAKKRQEIAQKAKNHQIAKSISENNGFTKLRFRHKIIQNMRKMLSGLGK